MDVFALVSANQKKTVAARRWYQRKHILVDLISKKGEMAFTSGKKCLETYQPIDLAPYVGRRTANPFPLDMRFQHKFCEVCGDLMPIRIVEDPWRPSLGMLIQRCEKHNAFIWCNPQVVTYSGTTVPVIGTDERPPTLVRATPSEEEVVSNAAAGFTGRTENSGLSTKTLICLWGVVVVLLLAILMK